MTIGREEKFPAVGEKIRNPSNLSLNVICSRALPSTIDQIQIEVAAARVLHVRREDDLLARAARKNGARVRGRPTPLGDPSCRLLPSRFITNTIQAARCH
jgi:hypothetical protein